MAEGIRAIESGAATRPSIYRERSIKHGIFVLIVLLIAWCLTLDAQTPSPSIGSPPAPTPACGEAEFRQFDFWLGSWKVTNPQGKEVGTSEIIRASEGFVVREQWKSASGKTGMSINYYDPNDHKWHQDWVGGDGTILHLVGRLIGDAMVLTGVTKSGTGTTLNRISWTPLAGGKVKQEWSTSDDQGKTWQSSFVGIYEHPTSGE
jgi:hypothetical protein